MERLPPTNPPKRQLFVKKLVTLQSNHRVLTSKAKRALSIFFKAAILLGVAWVLYNKLSDHQNLRDFNRLINDLGTRTVFITVGIVVALMFVNWFFEVGKWRYLCRHIEKISFFRATQSVFCGLTWAVFTPNRLGEYGGRVMFLSPRKRIFGVVAMGVGALAQLVLTSVAGSLSIAWFASRFLDLEPWAVVGVWVFAACYASVFIILYFNVRWINTLVSRIGFMRKLHRFFEVLTRYGRKELLTVFAYSLTRFIIFTSQYCILMLVLLPELPFFPMLWMIFILFFVQSALPSLDLFDFGVRSVTASYLYGYINDQDIAIMAIVSCIWFVNLILPAIIGSVFVLKINFFGHSNR